MVFLSFTLLLSRGYLVVRQCTVLVGSRDHMRLYRDCFSSITKLNHSSCFVHKKIWSNLAVDDLHKHGSFFISLGATLHDSYALCKKDETQVSAINRNVLRNCPPVCSLHFPLAYIRFAPPALWFGKFCENLLEPRLQQPTLPKKVVFDSIFAMFLAILKPKNVNLATFLFNHTYFWVQSLKNQTFARIFSQWNRISGKLR